MTDTIIRPYVADDQSGVFALIIPIQREEFGIAIDAEDQPDLGSIPSFYQSGCGGFWVAERDEQIVATIGLKDIGDRQAALRKMFVAASVRGKEHKLAAKLLETLLDHAKQAGTRNIFLGTTEAFLAAHRFYEKNGFIEIPQTALPASFPVMSVDRKFYRFTLAV